VLSTADRTQRFSVLLDEIGLGHLTSTNPLKAIHVFQDNGIEINPRNKTQKSIFVRLPLLKTSNYALYFAFQGSSR
jgi:hypothetical protein